MTNVARAEAGQPDRLDVPTSPLQSSYTNTSQKGDKHMATRARKAVAEATGAGTATKAATGRTPRKPAQPKAAEAKANGANGVEKVGKPPKGYAAEKKAEAEAAMPKGQAPRKPQAAKATDTVEVAATPAVGDDEQVAKEARIKELSDQINALLAQSAGTEVDDRESRKAERELAREERESAREARKAEREARRNSPEKVAKAAASATVRQLRQYVATAGDERLPSQIKADLLKALAVQVRTSFEECLSAADEAAEAIELARELAEAQAEEVKAA